LLQNCCLSLTREVARQTVKLLRNSVLGSL
jgi:hypothetical protein